MKTYHPMKLQNKNTYTAEIIIQRHPQLGTLFNQVVFVMHAVFCCELYECMYSLIYYLTSANYFLLVSRIKLNIKAYILFDLFHLLVNPSLHCKKSTSISVAA